MIFIRFRRNIPAICHICFIVIGNEIFVIVNIFVQEEITILSVNHNRFCYAIRLIRQRFFSLLITSHSVWNGIFRLYPNNFVDKIKSCLFKYFMKVVRYRITYAFKFSSGSFCYNRWNIDNKKSAFLQNFIASRKNFFHFFKIFFVWVIIWIFSCIVIRRRSKN